MAGSKITNHHRKLLRQLQRNNRNLKQAALIQIFARDYGVQFSSSSASRALSDDYLFLDNANDESRDQTYRNRRYKWPELDEMILVWYILELKKGSQISTEAIYQKASDFWPHTSYASSASKLPVFSNSWASEWMTRNSVQYLNAVSQTPNISEILANYEPSCQYAMAEVGLLYNHIAYFDASAPEPTFARNYRLERFTTVFCCNAALLQDIPLWFIGESTSPTSVGANVWRSNCNAWMTPKIMIEWLTEFEKTMAKQRKHVTLVMNDTAAHRAAVAKLSDPLNRYHLVHTRIIWARNNPINLGISEMWKGRVKRLMLEHVVAQLKLTKQRPHIGVGLAISWAVEVWDSNKELFSRSFRRFIVGNDSVFFDTSGENMSSIQAIELDDAAAESALVRFRHLHFTISALLENVKKFAQELGMCRTPEGVTVSVEDYVFNDQEIVIDDLKDVDLYVISAFGHNGVARKPIGDTLTHAEALHLLDQLYNYESAQPRELACEAFASVDNTVCKDLLRVMSDYRKAIRFRCYKENWNA